MRRLSLSGVTVIVVVRHFARAVSAGGITQIDKEARCSEGVVAGGCGHGEARKKGSHAPSF